MLRFLLLAFRSPHYGGNTQTLAFAAKNAGLMRFKGERKFGGITGYYTCKS